MNASAIPLRALLLATLTASFQACFTRVAPTPSPVPGFRMWKTEELGIAWLYGNPDAEFLVTVQLPPDASGVASKGKSEGLSGSRHAAKEAVFGLGEGREELTIRYELTQEGDYVRHAASINGTHYLLADGRLFTVDARGDGAPKVAQL